ncbi:MAG: 7-cyano-7-deazaguanine synthase [Thermoguttaceae bacterium]|nr:7-cyano-7-deazaguanine synthase [Thermoguttaceae bacterium]MDW8038739.1 7-cyano-7-deazaguanine synthase [Thermoguttaceae bacterium]
MPKAVVLFSGGLDSSLAVRIMQQQGWEVEALHIQLMFDKPRTNLAQTAGQLGVPLVMLPVEEDYIEIIRRPRFGYGKGVNPCIDCRIYMCRLARRRMEAIGASLVVSGELVGQRPSSQKRRDLELIEIYSGLEGRLLRPLSAKLLKPTIPEQEGLLDREKLYDFQGRGRGALIELAQQLGIRQIPTPSPGCRLTDLSFAPRVRDLLQHDSQANRADFELLNFGRHVRLDPAHKVVLGRNASENQAIWALVQRFRPARWTVLDPVDFMGPVAVLVGPATPEALQQAASLVARYGDCMDQGKVRILEPGAREADVLMVSRPPADSPLPRPC